MRKSIFTIIIFIIIIVILVALLYFFNTIPHKQYSNSYFNIETYASGDGEYWHNLCIHKEQTPFI